MAVSWQGAGFEGLQHLRGGAGLFNAAHGDKQLAQGGLRLAALQAVGTQRGKLRTQQSLVRASEHLTGLAPFPRTV